MTQKFNFKRLGEPIEADWPVKVSVPQDGGKATVEVFSARFRITPPTDPQEPATPEEALAAEALEAVDDVDKAKAGTLAVYRRFFVGFGKPTNETEELTDDVLWQLVTTPFTRDAILSAYREFARGAGTKN